MEGFKEFQGKDLDDAIGQACSYYDTLREKLEIEIISDSKSGIFGIVGARKAKIKARRVQLRNAVDSILGRGRDGAGESTPPPAKAARQQQDKQGDKPARSADTRGEARTGRATKADEQPRQDSPTVDNEQGTDCVAADLDEARVDTERTNERDGDSGRKARNPRPPRSTASAPNSRDSREPREAREPRSTEPRSDQRHDHRSPEYRNDGNSILSGQVLGYVPEVEDDEQASFGPGNELPNSHDHYGDRNAKPRRGRTPRPPQGRAENVAPRTDHAAPRNENTGSRTDHAAPRAVSTSVLAGTLDSDALHEDALSEGLPVIAFDQLDQDRLCAISLEAVGRLVAPIVGDVPLSVDLGDNRVNVVLDCGEDSGLLIGREGQTLASLQYLASRLVSRAMGAAVRVQLDAGEYRVRQDEKLRDLALALAERVRATGKSHSTRPLSSYHRRIVHMALQETVDIQTRSSGDGALKRVVIQKKRGN